MSRIEFNNVVKTFVKDGETKTIIKGVDLVIEQGEFVVFVGPSGCGKSTMLRMVAGLEDISSGDLSFDHISVNHMSPSERGIGMVFQSYALYPHMTIAENIAFPLKMAGGHSRDEIQASVEKVSELLEITHLLKNKPSQLSGGQRQRVAIGRALVRDPRVFLLDEPLSNLDAALRVRMRLNLAEYHQTLGCTIIYVTHDQIEATTLADKVVVLNAGNIEQVGSPMELYHFPKTRFVAEFIGSPKMNMLPVVYEGDENGMAKVSLRDQSILTDVRAEDVQASTGGLLYLGARPENLDIGEDNALSVEIADQEFMGAESLLYADLPDIEEPLLVRCPGTLLVKQGSRVNISFPKDKCFLFEENGNAIPRNLSLDQLIVQAG